MSNNNYREDTNMRLSYWKYTTYILNMLKNTVDILIFPDKVIDIWIMLLTKKIAILEILFCRKKVKSLC